MDTQKISKIKKVKTVRTVTFHQCDVKETLKVTKKVKKKKKRIQHIDLSDVSEHDHKDSGNIDKDKPKGIRKKCKVSKKKQKNCSHKKKTVELTQSPTKQIIDSLCSASNMLVVPDQPILNRPTPQCTRKACRSAISGANNHSIRRDKTHKKKRERDHKCKKVSTTSMSLLSSLVNLEDVSSDSFISYDDDVHENKIEALIRRTKDRDRQMDSSFTESFEPSVASTPNPYTQQESDWTLETINSIEDDIQEGSFDFESNHSLHSQATLILEPQADNLPVKLENSETFPQIKNETDSYSPTNYIGNKQYVYIRYQ